MAITPGGLPTPPLTCNGADVRKNDHRPSRSQILESVSRSHISPMGVPHCTSSHSCRHQPVSIGGGHAVDRQFCVWAKWDGLYPG